MAQSLLSRLRMNVSLYQAAAALNANSRWQDVVAENLASSSIPGFRKQSLSTAAVQAGLMSVGRPNSISGRPPNFLTFRPADGFRQLSSRGNGLSTGNDKNAAIDGEGFFQVQQRGNGTPAVTRDGEFKVNSKASW